jgi:cytochrome c biogenesis protein CcmG, thiol:disulfide interchange protein DsbE
MRKMRVMLNIALFIFLLGTGYIFRTDFYGTAQAELESGVAVGNVMPTFTATDLNGETIQVGDTGIPYVINFWATWCPPCNAELPELNDFASDHTSDIQFYAINIEESTNTIANFFQNNGYSLPVLLDSDGNISQEFRIRAVPTTIIVDSQGVIRYRKTGGVTKAELEDVINNL